MKKFKTLFFIITILFLSIYGFGLIQEESQQNSLISQGIDYYKDGEYDSAIRVLQEVINISVKGRFFAMMLIALDMLQ